MATITVNEVALGIESFGADDAPLVLLAGGTTMLSWPDALCEHLAAGGRRVVRYDLRASGASTTADPEAPAYTLRDLAVDAAALVDGLGGGPAHLRPARRRSLPRGDRRRRDGVVERGHLGDHRLPVGPVGPAGRAAQPRGRACSSSRRRASSGSSPRTGRSGPASRTAEVAEAMLALP